MRGDTLASWFKDNAMFLAVLATVAGLAATTLGVFGVVIPENAPDFLSGILDDIGNWGYWLLALGLVALIGGIWKIWAMVANRNKFERLINVDSKAKFQRNLDELERLAWTLGRDYPKRVSEKKRMFRLE